MKSLIFVLILFIGGILSPARAQSSQALIPIVDSAESVFRTAIQAYEDGEYDIADRLFGVAANNYELHRKTTAAFLMQGKSLYMQQRFEEATRVLDTLIQTYPTTRYIGEAERIIGLASGEVDPAVTTAPAFRLGIALPLNEEAATFSQQLFNGIHMAVNEYNNQMPVMGSELPIPSPKIIMVFRDTNNEPEQARRAIRELVQVENVDAIIGPLFSNEAIAAAGEAERLQTVLIAPLATAEAVSFNKTYVFQANPTLEVRGRLMARFAVNSLGINSIGIMADDSNSESLGMVRGFQKEFYELQAAYPDKKLDLSFQEYISDTSSWFRLREAVSPDTLLKARAMYLPINGGNASTLIGGLLTSLERMSMGGQIRIIGNKEWHNVTSSALASNYSATYSNDFHVAADDSVALDFRARYTSTFSTDPIRLSYSGYDVTNFITTHLSTYANSSQYPLHLLFRQGGEYEGIGNRINFSNGNINEAIFYHRYRQGQSELLK